MKLAAAGDREETQEFEADEPTRLSPKPEIKVADSWKEKGQEQC
jgi:hypothetical protein